VQDTTYAPGKVVHHSPQQNEAADLLLMESTYGNRQHPKTDPRPQMAAAISQCVQRGGSVMVPAFAVERTQKFLFVLKELMEQKQIPRVPVFCDSPMAIHAVEVFLKHTEEFSDETRELVARYGSPLTWDGFNFCRTPQESKKINDTKYPSIIVSSNGMCMGGRIQHHLLQRLPDPRNMVLFIGFQAPGTRGAQIKEGGKEVKIFGQIVPVRAQSVAIEQFSDHADTPEILTWLHSFQKLPAVTWLVHGEPAAAAQLRQAIVSDLKCPVEIAHYLQKAPVS
jgi:metallo-beta-lactamase family protein